MSAHSVARCKLAKVLTRNLSTLHSESTVWEKCTVQTMNNFRGNERCCLGNDALNNCFFPGSHNYSLFKNILHVLFTPGHLEVLGFCGSNLKPSHCWSNCEPDSNKMCPGGMCAKISLRFSWFASLKSVFGFFNIAISCIQGWMMDTPNWRATNMIKGSEHLSCKERLKSGDFQFRKWYRGYMIESKW